jgi:multicomponent Na+:H+ antiporter subunit D
MNSLVAMPVAIPLGMAALLAAGNRHIPRRCADVASLLTALASGVIALRLMVLARHEPLVYWFGGWTPRSGMALGISFVVDPIGAGLAAFTCLLMLAALVFSLEYFDSVGTIYHALMMGFLAGMCGFCLTGDLFNLFVFFEVMSASAFALCGYKNEDSNAQQGALNFAITNTIGAFMVLTGIALLYSRTGALNMAQIGRALGNQNDRLVIFAFVLILCGFYVKAAAFPFHFWLADAHAVAPTPVCVLFSGVMVELGIYGVARVYWSILDGPFASHRPALRVVLLTIGTLTAVVGAAMCFGQRHIKRLLAFSTISHVGLLIIAFALLKPDGLAGAAEYTIGHGLVKASLFIVAGILLHRFGSVDQTELHGKACDSPWTGLVFFVGGLGLCSMPPFGTFLGEHAIEEAAIRDGHGWTTIVFFLAGALTAAAVFRVAGHVFLGRGPKEDRSTKGAKNIKEERETDGGRGDGVPATMFIPALVLVVLAASMSLLPNFHEQVRASAYTIADRAGYQARVLDDMKLPDLKPEKEASPMRGSLLRSFGTVVAALLLAWFTLSPKWPERRKRPYAWPIRGPLYALRAIHTGHVGDYTAFLTFGVAAIGLVLGLLIRAFGV